jgi:hypothetical protein
MFVSLYGEVGEVLNVEHFYLNDFLSCKEFNYVGPDGWFDFNLCDSDVTSSEDDEVTSSNGQGPLLNPQFSSNPILFSIET